MMRSTDCGRAWKESKQPPAFAKVPAGETGSAVDHTFWLTPGHASEPDVWFSGTSPQGVFRSADGGDTWQAFSYINDDPQYREWMGTVQDGTPDDAKMHSIIVDPRDAKHMYFGVSGGGVHETKGGGKSWQVIIDGMEVVQGYNLDPKLPTCHDRHCLHFFRPVCVTSVSPIPRVAQGYACFNRDECLPTESPCATCRFRAQCAWQVPPACSRLRQRRCWRNARAHRAWRGWI